MKKGLVTFDLESATIIVNSNMVFRASDIETDAVIMGPTKFVEDNAGISCAALCIWDPETKTKTTEFYEAPPGKQAIGPGTALAADLFWRLVELSETHDIVTWNGTKFDFQVLANHIRGKDAKEKMEDLVWNHVDMMLMVTFSKGWYLSLDTALEGIGKSKEHVVVLSDGVPITDMYGGLAPLLWAINERKAVLDYLQGDVDYLMDLALSVREHGRMGWQSNSGRQQSLYLPLTSVRDCFDIPEPDVSWMDNPPKRQDFVEWMEVLR